MSAADLESLRAQLRDRYRIERELGRGGMGAVYLARELRLDRLVALKVLPPSVASDAGLRERFLRETRTAASFSHPNIVPVHAVEEGEGLLCFAMGYVEGESLAERVKRSGPLPPREAIRLMLDTAYALAYAHGRGVVHRDIKPDNIMIERATGRALVMDFGISRRIDTTPAAGAGLTRVGEVVGTPEYMSPEQASGDDVDGRSDLYSLGLVAWFALTGDTAMAAESTQKVLVKQLTTVLPSLGEVVRELPTPLVEAVDRCVAKDPAARYVDAGQLVEALEKAQQAAPEIPLTVRLLASELGGLIQLFTFQALLLGILLINVNEHGFERVDNLVPVILLVAVMITRGLQVVFEIGRVMREGYDPASLRVALLAVSEEAGSARRTRARDPVILERRRQTVRRAVRNLGIAAGLIGLMFVLRVPNGMGGWRLGMLATTSLFTGLALVGVSLVLLMRSPFRMPLSERVFRALWLGPPGRLVFAWAGRLARKQYAAADARVVATAPTAALARTPVASAVVSPPPSAGTVPAAAPRNATNAAPRDATNAAPSGALGNEAPPAITAPRARASAAESPDAPPARLDAIERRLDALEAWRERQR